MGPIAKGLLVAQLLASCVSHRNEVVVAVSAFSAPNDQLRRDTPICFIEEAAQDASLELRSRYGDISEICSTVARSKGLQVVPASSKSCLTVQIGWHAGDGQSFYLGSSSSCGSIYGSVFCSSQAVNVTYFRKGLQLDFVDLVGNHATKVHEIRATMATESPGFLNTTAVALCRAAFQDFPEKMTQREYTTDIMMPKMTEPVGH